MRLTLDLGVLQWECWKYLPLWIPLKTKRSFWETFGYFLSKRVSKFLIMILNMKLLMFMLLYFVLLRRGTLGMFMYLIFLLQNILDQWDICWKLKYPRVWTNLPLHPPLKQRASLTWSLALFSLLLCPKIRNLGKCLPL